MNDKTTPEAVAFRKASAEFAACRDALLDSALATADADDADLCGDGFEAAMDAQVEAARQYRVANDRQKAAFGRYRQAEHRRRQAAKETP